MTLEATPSSPPGQSTLTPARRMSPYSMYWWTNNTITNIPQASVGWLVGQGWQITDIAWNNTTTPPTPSFTLARRSLQNWLVLQSLLNSYTIALNDANFFNAVRYNQVVTSWTRLLEDAQEQFDAQVENSNDHVTLFLGNLDTYMAEIETALDATETEVTSAAEGISGKLDEYEARLTEFETNYATHAAQIEILLTAQATALATYLADYASVIGDMDTDYTALLGSISASLAASTSDLADHILAYEVKLDALETAYGTYEDAVAALLATATSQIDGYATQAATIVSTMSADHTALDTSIGTLLTSADALVGPYIASSDTLFGYLLTDYTTHATTALGYLTDLGTAELARINEEFANSLAAQLQQLTDRGFYSSGMIASITQENTNKKNEAIAALNDKLAREKLENEHRLYEQQFAMRLKTIDGQDRTYALRRDAINFRAEWLGKLYALLQEVRVRTNAIQSGLFGLRDGVTRFGVEVTAGLYGKQEQMLTRLADGKDRVYQLRDALSHWSVDNTYKLEADLAALRQATTDQATKGFGATDAIDQQVAAQRDKLLAQINDALGSNMKGRETYMAVKARNTEFLAEQRKQINLQRMETAVKRLEALTSTHDQEMKLLAYQLDERNKLMIGLYGFVERRNDVAPDFSELTKLCTGLGDSGGGWVTP